MLAAWGAGRFCTWLPLQGGQYPLEVGQLASGVRGLWKKAQSCRVGKRRVSSRGSWGGPPHPLGLVAGGTRMEPC